MAIGDAYCSEEEYKAAISQTSADAAHVNKDYLVAISRYIDHKLDRRSGFNLDAAATIRIYTVPAARPSRPDWAESENPWLYGGLHRVLDVEDIGGAITSILLDEGNDGTYSTTLTTNDYELLPLNAAVGPEAHPYKQIGLTPWGSYASWPSGRRVKVTAIHGWPSVPKAIKAATIELTAMLQIKSPFATGRINELDQVVEASPQARAVLMGLMTNYSAGVFF